MSNALVLYPKSIHGNEERNLGIVGYSTHDGKFG